MGPWQRKSFNLRKKDASSIILSSPLEGPGVGDVDGLTWEGYGVCKEAGSPVGKGKKV